MSETAHSAMSKRKSLSTEVSLIADPLDKLERELQVGQKVLAANKIALPADIAKRLTRMNQMVAPATAASIVLTCFVDLFLEPPPPTLHSRTVGTVRCAKGGVQHSTRTRFQKTASVAFVQLDSGAAEAPQVVSPSAVVLQPLRTHLATVPRGPYLVRVPSSASVEEATAIVQESLRNIQLQERSMIASSGAEHINATSTLYGNPVVTVNEISSKREHSVMKASDVGSSSAAARPLGIVAGASSPATILASKCVVPEDILGANFVSTNSLGNMPIDIPPYRSELSKAETRRLLGMSGMASHEDHSAHSTMSEESFHAFTATTPSARDIGSLSGNFERAADAASLHRSAFLTQRMTLRLCDAFGRVLHHSKPHAAALGDTLEPKSKSIMSCFPRNAINFFVCLSPDPEHHRELIRQENQIELMQKQDSLRQLCNHRGCNEDEIEAHRQEVARQQLLNSLAKDKSIREQLTRPSATASFRSFMKEEAIEENQKQRLKEQRKRQEERETFKEEVRVRTKQFYVAMFRLNTDFDSFVAELHSDEQTSWTELMTHVAQTSAETKRRERIQQRFHSIGGETDSKALSVFHDGVQY